MPCQSCRSRSPAGRAAARKTGCETVFDKGQEIQFFHEVDLTSFDTPYVSHTAEEGQSLRLLQSHGWLDGTILEAFHSSGYDSSVPDSWPLVLPASKLRFTDREGSPADAGTRRVAIDKIREPRTKPPLLSLAFVRRGGTNHLEHKGTLGLAPSDRYMSGIVKDALMTHPELTRRDQESAVHDFEVFSIFVRDSKDVESLAKAAPQIASGFRAEHRTCFWMIYPRQWEDCGGMQLLGYVPPDILFRAMRAFEGAGVTSGFPHSADLYERITSKSWMVSLAMDPEAKLPATVSLAKAMVMRSPRWAAQQALLALNLIREQNPFTSSTGEAPAPSAINEHGVKKGVVKLGWSWSAQDVYVFNNEEELGNHLYSSLTEEGSEADTVYVQEWVDFDFEARLYFLPPVDWAKKQRLLPERIEYTSWHAEPNDESQPHGFQIIPEEKCLALWENDKGALKAGLEEAVDISQYLLAWLLSVDARPVPMVRLDFLLRRRAPGKARVVFGEFCEMGAECLGWEAGLSAMWRAALDHILHRDRNS